MKLKVTNKLHELFKRLDKVPLKQNVLFMSEFDYRDIVKYKNE